MKPSTTCHVLRALTRAVGYTTTIGPSGLYTVEPEMPSVDQSSDSFRDAWFGYNLARKREVDGSDTEEAAKRSFKESEARCATIEERGILENLDWYSKNVLLRARNIAHEILGPLPRDWYQECSFTGGASTSRRRSESHPALKWWASPTLDVTTSALKHLLCLKSSSEVLDAVWQMPGNLSMTTDSRKSSPFFRLVRGSRQTFVEKNYKTKRTILIEPDGNMVLQKGIGNIIRQRLRSRGINLNSQTRNQRLAFAGSITGSLGTIDIAAASDSMTFAVLRLLLPWDWHRTILEIRSPKYQDQEGVWHDLIKVSSMGNGFTFELESLIFYCLTQAVVDILKPEDTRVGIFGDDIIVASSVCGYLQEILSRCGFELNKSKSFWRGSFRESCGKHYHNGVDVTPVYCKADLDTPDEICRLYNQVRLWARCGTDIDHDERFSTALGTMLNLLKKEERIQVPTSYGPNAGLYFGDVSHRKIRFYRNRKGWDMLSFYTYSRHTTDLTERCDDEVRWLFQHLEGWEASCPLGTSEYTSFALVREGELVRRQVAIPAARVVWPIP